MSQNALFRIVTIDRGKIIERFLNIHNNYHRTHITEIRCNRLNVAKLIGSFSTEKGDLLESRGKTFYECDVFSEIWKGLA